MVRDTSIKPWRMLSIPTGNLVQLGGLLGGLAVVVRAARAPRRIQPRLLFAGWLLTYFCDHAIAHWLIGRLAGMRFRGYGLHGTTAPGWYPPGLRSIFTHLPLLSARMEPGTLQAASPHARMAMYLAAPLLTLLVGLGIPAYGLARGIAGSKRLLIGAGIWFTPMLVVETIRPGGDLYRALRELQRL